MIMKKIYRSLMTTASVILFLFTSTLCAYAQKTTVTGTVTEASGSAFPGVNVLIKGTSSGTATDGEGKFTIEAGPEDILVFSFIGYKSQEVQVGNQTSISVQLMEDVSTLNEIVVTGYGEMARTDLSGAQATINSEAITRTINTTIDQAIQGRVAGVYVTQNSGQPGGGISVNIRGINSISGSNEPLYVIDGVQMQQSSIVNYGSTSSINPLAAINPNDIENIEFLKGPSATAIYGSRGTNGVVLVTTKRGKAGETKVNYSFLYSLQDTPKNLDVLNLREYATLYKDIRDLAGGEVPPEFQNPSLLGEGTNWQDELFEEAAIQQHQLSLSGGTDKTRYYLSSEYFDQGGVVQGSHFKRYSVSLNVDNDVRKWLKLGANMNIFNTEEQVSAIQGSVINSALTIAPNIPVKNPDGSWGGASGNNGNPVQFTPLNPVAISNLVDNNFTKRGFRGGLYANIELYKGLVFKTTLNGNFADTRQENFTPTYRLGDRVNDQASLSIYEGRDNYWNWNQLLQYDFKVGAHNFIVMASHEAQQSSWESLSGEKVGFVSNEIPDLNLGDALGAKAGGGQGLWAMESYFGRLNYNYNERYYLQAAIRADGSVNFGPENKWGYFPSVSGAWRISEETFMDNVAVIDELKIRLETGITGNQGNTSYLAPLTASATPNWGTGYFQGRFGNPSLKWEETLTNNIGFDLAFLDNRISIQADFYIKQTENLIMTAPLPHYLGVNGEGGITPPPINIGSMENKGWEFSVNTVNVSSGDWKWTSDFNISGFKAKVTEFYTETAFVDRKPWYVGDSGSGNNWAQRAAVGQAPWLFQGYIEEGLFQSVEEIAASARPADNTGTPYAPSVNTVWVGDVKYKDLNGDGIINEQDRTNIGNPWPKFMFGFNNSVSWKGFELNVFINGVYGNDVYNVLRFNNTNPNNTNLGRNMLQEAFNYARVVDDGSGPRIQNAETDVPRISYSNVNGNFLRFTDKYVEDGSYIRIKNIQLRYNIPGTLLSKQNVVQSAFVTIGAQNLFTFTKYKGYDPEVGAYVGQNAASDNQAIGLDYGRYPLTPMYSVNVGIEF